MRMLAGSSHVFPKGEAVSLTFVRSQTRPRLSAEDLLLAERAREGLLEEPLGDGMKLSVMGIHQGLPSSARIEVAEMLFSQLHGAFEAVSGLGCASASEALSSKGVRVLLTNNILISSDERIVISSNGAGPPNPSLNGFVDSATMKGVADPGLISRAAAKELYEEYGISEFPGLDIHSIHVTSSRSLPLAVRVFGSVRLPLTFDEIERAKEGAEDAWENPILISVRNTRKAIEEFAAKAPGLGALLLTYAERAL